MEAEKWNGIITRMLVLKSDPRPGIANHAMVTLDKISELRNVIGSDFETLVKAHEKNLQ